MRISNNLPTKGLKAERKRSESQFETLRFRSNGQEFIYPKSAPILDYFETDYKDAYTIWYEWLSKQANPIETVLEIGRENNSIKQHPLGFTVVYLSPFPQTLEDGNFYSATGQESIVRCNIYENGGANDPHTHEFYSVGGPVVGDVKYVFYDVRPCQVGDSEEDLYYGYRTTVSPDGTNKIELVFRKGLHAGVSRTLALSPGDSYSIRPAEQVSHGERGGEFHGVDVEAGRVCMTLFTKEPARHMGRNLFLSQNPNRAGSY